MIKFRSLYSGSSGNSLFLATDKTRLLIDAGLSGIKIENALKEIDEDPKEIDGILISHEHQDHICGAGVLSRRFDIPIYANYLTWLELDKEIGKINKKNRKIIEEDSFELRDIGVKPFTVSHDAACPLAFSFFIGDKKVSLVTDLGYISDIVRDNALYSDILLLESNHDVGMLEKGPYPNFLKERILSDIGHLSNETASSFICEAASKGTRAIILGHLSKVNNKPKLAYDLAYKKLKDLGVEFNKDLILSIARRDGRGDCFVFNGGALNGN